MAEKCSTDCLNEEAVAENRKIIDDFEGLPDTADFWKGRPVIELRPLFFITISG